MLSAQKLFFLYYFENIVCVYDMHPYIASYVCALIAFAKQAKLLAYAVQFSAYRKINAWFWLHLEVPRK
jgi:hypothetical protein